MQDLRGRVEVRFDRQKSNAYREIKAPRAAGARIEIENALAMSYVGFVGVSIENRCKSGCYRVEADSLHIVKHVNVVTFQQQDFCFWQVAARSTSINVAADGGDRGDGGERLEDVGIADVAEV